jgi:hypothetical protein
MKRGGVRVRTLVFPRGPRAYFSILLHWRLRSGAPEARTFFLFRRAALMERVAKVLVITQPLYRKHEKKSLSKDFFLNWRGE